MTLVIAPTLAALAIVGHAQQVAKTHWHEDPCGGQVEITYQSMPPALNAVSSWTLPDHGDCGIAFNTGPVWGGAPWAKFCTVMVHEYGHLLGHEHSDDVADIMYPIYLGPVSGCEESAA